MAQMMSVFEEGERFLTTVRGGYFRLWEITDDGSVVEVPTR